MAPLQTLIKINYKYYHRFLESVLTIYKLFQLSEKWSQQAVTQMILGCGIFIGFQFSLNYQNHIPLNEDCQLGKNAFTNYCENGAAYP